MKIIKIILYLLMTANFACNDLAKKADTWKKERISANLVNNPITAQQVKQEGPITDLSFDKLSHNFGEIILGESVSHLFVFTNTGHGDLIISNAKGSCGCTVPKWPRKPIAPGEEAEIKVTFNSNGREGEQKKTVTLVTNAIPNTIVLTISGRVIASKKQIN